MKNTSWCFIWWYLGQAGTAASTLKLFAQCEIIIYGKKKKKKTEWQGSAGEGLCVNQVRRTDKEADQMGWYQIQKKC